MFGAGRKPKRLPPPPARPGLDITISISLSKGFSSWDYWNRFRPAGPRCRHGLWSTAPRASANRHLASCTPKPIFIQTEDGLGEIDCHKFPLANRSTMSTRGTDRTLVEPHDYQTVVLDSLDWAERTDLGRAVPATTA